MTPPPSRAALKEKAEAFVELKCGEHPYPHDHSKIAEWLAEFAEGEVGELRKALQSIIDLPAHPMRKKAVEIAMKALTQPPTTESE